MCYKILKPLSIHKNCLEGIGGKMILGPQAGIWWDIISFYSMMAFVLFSCSLVFLCNPISSLLPHSSQSATLFISAFYLLLITDNS